jgi:hypothetical protein
MSATPSTCGLHSTLNFTITSWAACAPGLLADEDWLAWAQQAAPPVPQRQGLESDAPPLAEMPAMARRRLSPLGRLAVQAAWRCAGSDGPGFPVVLASRYGDVHRTLELQDALAQGRSLSPTAFGLSVHNAVGAQYSIARGDRANYLSIAAGEASAAAGLVEAVSLLEDGAPEVMLVCYDEGLPAPYARYDAATPSEAAWAWAWRIAAASSDARQPSFSLALGDETPQSTPSSLPFGLDLLRFTLSGQPRWSHAVESQHWTGQRA